MFANIGICSFRRQSHTNNPNVHYFSAFMISKPSLFFNIFCLAHLRDVELQSYNQKYISYEYIKTICHAKQTENLNEVEFDVLFAKIIIHFLL